MHAVKPWRAIVAAAFLTLTLPAGAAEPVRFGNPAGAAPDTPGVYEARPNLEHPNTADALFAREASLGGTGEVDAAKLAARKAHSSAVRDFANMMVSDHGKANQQLSAVLSANASKTSTTPDMDHKVMLDQLEKTSGEAFDVLYIRGQVAEHQKTVQLYEWIIDNGQDPRLTRYAMNTLPTVMRHLELARSIQAQLTGSAP